jgi:3-dehydroquinate synthetase
MRNPPSKTSLRVIMDTVSKETARRIDGGHTMSSEVERAVEFRGLETMLGLAVNPQASSQVRAIALYHINDLLKQWTTEPLPTDSAEAIHRQGMIARIEEFKKNPDKFVPEKPLEAPPGMPIGDDGEYDDGIF